MKRPNAKVASLAGVGLAGGVMAGFLLAFAMPTSMKQNAEDSLGQFSRSPDLSGAGEYAIPMEIPPQDLSPVGWSAPTDMYGSTTQSEEWVQPVDVYDAEAPYADDPASDQMTEVGMTDADLAPIVQDDGAAASAEAARAAASDVVAIENTAMAPAQDAGGQSVAASSDS